MGKGEGIRVQGVVSGVGIRVGRAREGTGGCRRVGKDVVMMSVCEG